VSAGPKPRAFVLRYEECLQTPKTGNFSEKMPKVSGPYRKYSRFRETFGGDFFRSALIGGRYLDISAVARRENAG